MNWVNQTSVTHYHTKHVGSGNFVISRIPEVKLHEPTPASDISEPGPSIQSEQTPVPAESIISDTTSVSTVSTQPSEAPQLTAATRSLVSQLRLGLLLPRKAPGYPPKKITLKTFGLTEQQALSVISRYPKATMVDLLKHLHLKDKKKWTLMRNMYDLNNIQLAQSDE